MASPDQDIPRYQMLVQCFLSGQMSEPQMQAHMAEDAGFRDFVLERLGAAGGSAGPDGPKGDRRSP